MPDTHTDVLVAGAGPAGLTLACELGLAGVRTTVLERDPAPPGFCRGFNLNARSLDLLEHRGLADRFLAEGPTLPATAFVGTAALDLAAMRTRHPYVLGIAQTRVEELLAERAEELGVRILRGHRLTGFREDGEGITADVTAPDGPLRLRCDWLAGCDGGRSTVRKAAGIAFPGTPARRFTLLGDVVPADPAALPFGPTAGPGGSVFAIPRPGYVRLVTAEPDPPEDRDEPVTPDRFQEVLDRALGRRVEIAEVRWLTRFGDAARLAERLRAGRVLLVGDAAHIHPPAGAVGVNAAIDDAMNLGWKLALVARGLAPERLLESYHRERHAAGARLLRDTRAQALLAAEGERLAPVRDLLGELATAEGTAGHVAETITGVNTRYPAHDEHGHPWEGRMIPGDGLLPAPARTGGGALLLDEAAAPAAVREAAASWNGRVTVTAVPSGRLPGTYAVLVRPDGHVGWVARPGAGAGAEAAGGAVRSALEWWFGPPAPLPVAG
ncbi:FAD-dependent oxidoreductase [Streptomyces mobaraensis NBRC 13819 = DSM 40847]|uniref:Monooxygenase FAD-binding protein n=1 Tax=Streptomyces mobaraensis (strain ATCC 29032 / DSM 40847 / JCM 4168 / NBRC 13819 / NCIMB 11159 / IPCR 16-22) TaxID=1223523 RepID=M3C857_STRM1|nr:FAD-dependent oxidoreductase [Streptomyces mobaraensis]EMF00156.1 monooxygenase FAD-binding protein [Streptomyces mobaraensis NBRC 13819 = DSM 40847]QTT72495.1 FAD-dependent oxidoreductase [Streptomyces mobaraensis NBRC 13819 = DSM 40847]